LFRNLNIYLLVLAGCLLFSCSEDRRPAIFKKKKIKVEQPDSHKVTKILKNYFEGQPTITADSFESAYIYAIYKERDFVPFFLNDKGLNPEAIHWIAFSDSIVYEYGIPKTKYFGKEVKGIKVTGKPDNQWVYSEILLFRSWIHAMNHSNKGWYDFEKHIEKTGLDTGFCSRVKNNISSGKAVGTFKSIQPENVRYQNLVNGLVQLYPLFAGKRDKTYELPEFKSDSIQWIKQAAAILVDKYYLRASEKDSVKQIIEGLKYFQKLNGLEADGRPGPSTDKELRRSIKSLFFQICLNIERIRQEHLEEPQRYLYANLPAAKLQVIHQNKVQWETRIIAGATATPSPQLSSRLQNIIVFPNWTVPYSISTKEMLPQLKKDSNYLQKKNFQLLDKGGNPIETSQVNWNEISAKNFSYTFRQNPGTGNALGYFKFNFINPHAVYLHDTPNRGLFANSYRWLSHGCIRVQNPDQLAKLLLKEDGVKDAEQMVETLLEKKAQKSLPIKMPFGVEIKYVTNSVTSNGKVQFHRDIYKYDEKELPKFSKFYSF